MKFREQLKYLNKDYEIVNPIYVEVAVSKDSGGTIYYSTIVNLQNELIFGVGRTKQFALKMLRESLTNYYESLISSDLDRHNCTEVFIADKNKLQRSINHV